LVRNFKTSKSCIEHISIETRSEEQRNISKGIMQDKVCRYIQRSAGANEMKNRNRKNIRKSSRGVQLSLNGNVETAKLLARCAFLEGEIKNKVARTFDAIQLKKKILWAIDILKKKCEGKGINDIAGVMGGKAWVKAVSADYIENELDRYDTLLQPIPHINPITVTFMDFYKHKATWKFEESEIIAVAEGLDQGLSTRKLAVLVGSNTEAIIKLVEVLDKRGIDLSSFNEVGGDVNVRSKWDSINKGSSRGLRSDKVTVEGCVRPCGY
jgi:hypothetical protein